MMDMLQALKLSSALFPLKKIESNTLNIAGFTLLIVLPPFFGLQNKKEQGLSSHCQYAAI